MSALPPDADRLRELLAKACLSQRAFARQIDISSRMVAYWCAGKQPVPKIALMAAEHLACCPATEAGRNERLGWTHEQLAREE